MRRRQFLGEGDRDGRQIHMDQALGALFQQRAGQADIAHDRIVGEHGKHRVALQRVLRHVGGRCAFGDQGLHRRDTAVPHRHAVARFQQVRRNMVAHAAQADKSDFHSAIPVLSGRQSPHRRGDVQIP